MSIADIGSLGEFIASIAVLITLVVIALQMKQQSKALKVTAYQDWAARQIQINEQMAPMLSALRRIDDDPDNVSADDVAMVMGTLAHGSIADSAFPSAKERVRLGADFRLARFVPLEGCCCKLH